MGSIITGGNNYRRLTAEQRDFYDIISIRAMSAGVGTPYLRAQIVNLFPVAVDLEEKGFTFAVDKRGRVYINFEKVMEKGVIWASGGLIHECYHPLLDHFNRRQPEHEIEDFWAWATDMEINQLLPAAAKKEMENDIYFPSTFGFPDGKRAEEYYDMLKELAEKNNKNGKGEGEGSGEGGQGSGSGSGQPGKERGKSGMPTPYEDAIGDCGSGQTGNNDPQEASRSEAPERSEMDHKFVRSETAKEIQRGASANSSKQGNGIGTMPAFITEWANQILTPPKVRWQSVLRSEYAMTQRRAKMGRSHVNPRLPGRVQPVEDIMFPKRKSHRINVGIAFDSSGSNFADLKYILGEVHDIIRRGGVDAVYAFSVDASVKDIKRIRRISEVEFVGGGGTDMTIAFEKLAEMKVDVGIILTDCETPWPSEPLDSKTHFIVAGMIGRESARSAFEEIPEFFRKVEIDLTQKV